MSGRRGTRARTAAARRRRPARGGATAGTRRRLVAAPHAPFVFATDVVDDLVDDVEAAGLDAFEDRRSSSVSGSSFGSAEKISPVVIVSDPRARVRVDELVDLVAR